MTPEQVTNLLDQLGQRLGPAGQHVFELAVRQVFIDGFTMLILTAIFLAVLGWSVPRIYAWAQDGGDDRAMLGVIAGAVYVLVGICLLIGDLAYIPAMLNPEYAALMNILRAVSGTH